MKERRRRLPVPLETWILHGLEGTLMLYFLQVLQPGGAAAKAMRGYRQQRLPERDEKEREQYG